MIENQNAGVTQKKKKYGRLKDFICFSVAAFISFSQVSPIWAAEGTRVFDEAGLFSAEEVQELETRIDEVRDSQDADLAVLTVEDAQGESAESYADDFYDSHGLGVGDDASGILLSIDMDNREIYVSTTGYAMKSEMGQKDFERRWRQRWSRRLKKRKHWQDAGGKRRPQS